MDDEKISDLFWARSESAISEASNKYGSYCRAIALRILRDERDSEECVNDTWLGAWNAMPPNRPAALAPFLGRITRNLALNRCKERCTEKRGAGELPLALEELQECIPARGRVEEVLDRMALSSALSRFLGSLPREQRVFFVQRYWYLCSVAEIAERSGAGVSKVKMSLLRSRKKLKFFLQKEGISL